MRSKKLIDAAISTFENKINDDTSIPTAHKVLGTLKKANCVLQKTKPNLTQYQAAAVEFKKACEKAVGDIKEKGLDKESLVGDWLNNLLTSFINALNHIISIPKKFSNRDISSTFFAKRDYVSTEIRKAFKEVSKIPGLLDGLQNDSGKQPH